jgi:hypothetical protein
MNTREPAGERDIGTFAISKCLFAPPDPLQIIPPLTQLLTDLLRFPNRRELIAPLSARHAYLVIFTKARMEATSRPVSPEQNLWDSILNSVSTRRSVPSGNVLILGEPSTGKTTLANALLQRLADGSRHESGEWFGKTDFALGYQWANVKEEGEEGLRYSPQTRNDTCSTLIMQ